MEWVQSKQFGNTYSFTNKTSWCNNTNTNSNEYIEFLSTIKETDNHFRVYDRLSHKDGDDICTDCTDIDVIKTDISRELLGFIKNPQICHVDRMMLFKTTDEDDTSMDKFIKLTKSPSYKDKYDPIGCINFTYSLFTANKTVRMISDKLSQFKPNITRSISSDYIMLSNLKNISHYIGVSSKLNEKPINMNDKLHILVIICVVFGRPVIEEYFKFPIKINIQCLLNSEESNIILTTSVYSFYETVLKHNKYIRKYVDAYKETKQNSTQDLFDDTFTTQQLILMSKDTGNTGIFKNCGLISLTTHGILKENSLYQGDIALKTVIKRSEDMNNKYEQDLVDFIAAHTYKIHLSLDIPITTGNMVYIEKILFQLGSSMKEYDSINQIKIRVINDSNIDLVRDSHHPLIVLYSCIGYNSHEQTIEQLQHGLEFTKSQSIELQNIPRWSNYIGSFHYAIQEDQLGDYGEESGAPSEENIWNGLVNIFVTNGSGDTKEILLQQNPLYLLKYYESVGDTDGGGVYTRFSGVKSKYNMLRTYSHKEQFESALLDIQVLLQYISDNKSKYNHINIPTDFYTLKENKEFLGLYDNLATFTLDSIDDQIDYYNNLLIETLK
ncbi:MAG: hypothetical protein ACW98X_12140 [Promethearchaeota archaeon]|jgi:hypothetical protein